MVLGCKLRKLRFIAWTPQLNFYLEPYGFSSCPTKNSVGLVWLCNIEKKRLQSHSGIKDVTNTHTHTHAHHMHTHTYAHTLIHPLTYTHTHPRTCLHTHVFILVYVERFSETFCWDVCSFCSPTKKLFLVPFRQDSFKSNLWSCGVPGPGVNPEPVLMYSIFSFWWQMGPPSGL